MKNLALKVCKNRNKIIIFSLILLVLSFIGMKLTKVNYDILVYLPQNIETIEGQNILTDDFNMGSYSIALVENMNSNEILKLEDKIKNVNGVNKVISIYDMVGTTIPLSMLPNDLVDKVHKDNTDLLMITFAGSTSSEETLNAVEEIRNITNDNVSQGGMSSMVLDTMNLSEKEILIYVVIAVLLCIIVLELSLDSYVIPFILLSNIGAAILFNLGSNIFLGDISYITKALVAVLQLGVTTDFSIFLYHSYEKKKGSGNKEKAMVEAIKETFASVTGSSLTTIAGFLVLCTMQLTLGKDLGIVMAKGVLLGVITVLTLFPSLLLMFDKLIEKTKHKPIIPNFNRLNKFIVKHHILIFIIFIIMIVPAYLANSKVDVYYKLDKSLPNTLESIKTNEILKSKYNIVSPEIILINNNLKTDDIINLINEIENVNGIDFALSFAKLKELGITENMISDDLVNIIENDSYQVILINSIYDIATPELNEQITKVNDIVKKYDSKGIIAGEGPLMKDLITICDIDFRNVNYSSIICIFIILFIVLKSLSLPLLLIMAIEFAIFTNMSVSYFGGTILPFIAPIVLGTIQLGATIDYAILLTTTYLENRKSISNKKEAMVKTLNYSGNSIFTSGMCFFAATFGVGIYSKIEMIGSLCSLISRGAIISMIVVITVLPSILLIFDKLIIKTTKMGGKNMKKKNIKKLAISVMLLSTMASTLPINTLALEKNETVYAKLNDNGSVKNVLVNEQLVNNDKLELIEDYSELKDILNISNDSTYKLDNNILKWNANGKNIFYQGMTDKVLPVNVDVTYKLDNEIMSIDNMLGKSGKVTITLKYTNNDIHNVLVNGRYVNLYTPFVVTLGTIIDGDNTNISINNGKIISTGTKNIIAGIATPGLYESLGLNELKNMDTITLSYTTESFELPNIYSVVTPKLLESSDLEIFNKMDDLYSKVSTLQTNMNAIEDGSKKVVEGSSKLKNGLASSINNLSKDGNALTDEQIALIKNQTVTNVKSTFTDEYKANIGNIAWDTVKKNLGNNDNVTKIVTDSVTNILTEYLKAANEYNDYVNCETGKAIMEKGGSMTPEQMVSCGVIKNDTVLPKLKEAATSSVINTASNISLYVAENVSKQVASSVSEQTALEVASKVSSTLAPTVANQVKNASIDTIKTSLNTLYNGVSELDKGINDLSNGISKFNSEGINKIYNLVNGNLKTTTDKINALTKLADAYKTFGGSNQNGETKFIMVIDSKKVKNEVNNINTTTNNTTLWGRIKNLFTR